MKERDEAGRENKRKERQRLVAMLERSEAMKRSRDGGRQQFM